MRQRVGRTLLHQSLNVYAALVLIYLMIPIAIILLFSFNDTQSRFLVINDYPAAAALSFILMLIILVMLLVYARFVGTEALTGAEEAPA